MNPIIPSAILNNSSIFSNTQTTTESSTTTTTTPVVYNTHPFLQTAACQSIAGAFTWAAILITGYHVKKKKLKLISFYLLINSLDLSSFTLL